MITAAVFYQSIARCERLANLRHAWGYVPVRSAVVQRTAAHS